MLDAAELLERIGRIRREVEAVERLLLSVGMNKSQARKLADLKETCSEMEAQLTSRKET